MHSQFPTPINKAAPGALFVAAWSLLACLQAHAQPEGQPEAPAPSALAASAPVTPTLSPVVVTGTRRALRVRAESESPVDVLGARELQASGAGDLASVLGQLLPSLNFPRPSVADASDAIRPAQLRGLSPDQALVLVDGKRRHTTAIVNVSGSQGRGSSPADLNSIPLAAIERIEVLRDGAAAQYGSDAIAGVINIVLKKGGTGGTAGLDVGQTDAGDGRRASASASAGRVLGDAGWLRLSLEVRDQDFTNRAGPDLRDPTEPRFGQVNQRQGDPDSRQNAAVLNGHYALTPELDLYAFGTLSERHSSAAATWRPAQTAVGSGVLRSPLYPEGFLPLEDSRSTDTGVVAGLRGEVSGWRWDASVNQGRNHFELAVDHTANLSLGAASPTRFDAGALLNQQTLLNADLVREFDAGLAEPLTVAWGVEWRRERYDIEAGEASSYSGSGAQGFSGFRPENAGSNARHSHALYLDLETAFIKNWTGGVALRAERYSDFGNATAAKLSSRYAFDPTVALRGTASTGFRAPSLAQQHYTITTTNFVVIDGVNTPVETGTFAVGSPAAQALGAVPLKAETSRNLSLGLLWHPQPQWETTIDAYQIDIRDRILFSANLVLPAALQAELAAQGVLAGAARYFTNAVDTRTRGVDIVSTWHQDWQDFGRSDFTLAYNHNKTSVTRVADNPALLTANALTLIDRQTLGRATVASPEDKLLLAAEHTRGEWRARLAATRYGSFTVPQNNAALDQTFGAAWVADASVGWKRGGWNVSVGVDNLTDREPDPVTSAGNLNTNGIFRFSNFSPFGFNGRQYYARASYSW